MVLNWELFCHLGHVTMPGDPSFLETLLIIASGAGDALHPIMLVYLNKELHSPISTVLLLRSLILVIKINPNFQVFGGKRIFHEQFLAFFFFFLRTIQFNSTILFNPKQAILDWPKWIYQHSFSQAPSGILCKRVSNSHPYLFKDYTRTFLCKFSWENFTQTMRKPC